MAKGFETLIVGLLLAAAPLAQAGSECYRADAETGELKFIGVADGNRFTGHFHEFNVSVCMRNRDLSTADIEVTVATGSADTDNRDRDSELHGEAFFHVEEHPEAVWQSGEIVAEGDTYLADGELTLRGITNDQPVRLKLNRTHDDMRLTGSAEIMRLEFNVGVGDEDLEDPEFIRNRVDLEFDLPLSAAEPEQ